MKVFSRFFNLFNKFLFAFSMLLRLSAKLFFQASVFLILLLKRMFEILGLVDKIEILLFKLRKDLIQVIRIIETQIFIKELRIQMNEILLEQHFKF